MTAFRLADDDWVVLVTAHHITVDFWSLILLLEEIAAGYADLAAGQTSRLAKATNNYADFVRRQQLLLAGTAATRLKTFWQEQLAGMPRTLELPLDHTRPPRFTGRAASEPLSFSAEAAAAVGHLAAAAGVTPAAVMLAAVKLLLARCSGQSRFLIGMPFAGRGEQRFADTVGFFVNMLPLPARLDDNPTFRELIRRTGDTLVAALEHEDYPLAAIIADARCGYDPSRNPLFQVSCTFEQSHRRSETGRAGFLFPDRAEAVSFAGLRQESFPVPQQACIHDLEFVFEQAADGFRGMLLFCRDLFEPATIAGLARGLEGLLPVLVATPDTPVADVAWPAAASLPAVQPRPEATVRELLGPVIKKRKSHPAFQLGGQRWTYRDLSSLSTAVSRAAAAAGLHAGDLIPVVANRQQGMLATVATMLAGAAPLPVAADQPVAALAELLDAANPRLIITAGEPHSGLLPATGAITIDLATLADDPPAGNASQASLSRPTSSDLAYCIATSGSTGRPKGVLVEQAALANLLSWRQQPLPVRPDDRMLLLFSHQFDAALGVTLATLAGGATVVVADDDSSRDIGRLIDQLIAEAITILPIVPSLLQLLSDHPRFSECTSLRQIWCGGEALPPALAETVSRLPGIELWNCYGPTEATVEAACWKVEPDSCRGRPRTPIGQAAAGAGLVVVDDQLRPVPDGMPGELVITGPGLARGYLGQPELTAKRFVLLPPGADGTAEGVRGYRTGDRCRRLADGNLEYLGRLDEQVKLRGYRVELGEIEASLQADPAVAAAAVKVIAADSPEARLAAYVVPALADDHRPDSSPVVQRLRQHLAAQLPAWKRPATITLLESLPTTASGKVDRNRLPEPSEPPRQHESYQPARTPLEAHLAAAWQTTLGLKQVGITQNFFDLGGTSLQAAMLAAGLSHDLGVEVPTVLFFDLAEIAAITRRLGELHPAAVTARFGEKSLQSADDAANAADHPLVVPLKPDGSLTPLFMIHPPGGIVVCYAAVARQLLPDRPLLCIRSRGLHGAEQLPDSLEDLAADYVAAIRATQPGGPYLVGGWSLGGVIASEVVRQLLAAGEAVDRLLLLDSALPEDSSDTETRSGREYGLDLGLMELGQLPAEKQLPFLYDHARKLGLIEATAPEELVAKVLAELQRLFAHHAKLCSSYQPQELAVDAVLFRPLETPGERHGPADRGWGRLLRSVEVRQVPGHHHSMVTPPHAAALAAAIDEALAEAAVSS